MSWLNRVRQTFRIYRDCGRDAAQRCNSRRAMSRCSELRLIPTHPGSSRLESRLATPEPSHALSCKASRSLASLLSRLAASRGHRKWRTRPARCGTSLRRVAVGATAINSLSMLRRRDRCRLSGDAVCRAGKQLFVWRRAMRLMVVVSRAPESPHHRAGIAAPPRRCRRGGGGGCLGVSGGRQV